MENIYFGVLLTAWQFRGEFEHPDTSSMSVEGIFITPNDDDDEVREALLNTFRTLWKKEGHYWHNLKLTAISYTSFGNETFCSEYDIEGGWYEDDDTVLSTVKHTIKIRKE